MPAPSLTPEAFIDHWSKAEANERAISQPVLLGLPQLLGVPQPSNSHHNGYPFEFRVKVPGSTVTNFFDRHAAAPVTAQELTTRFTRAKPQAVHEILESLVALGWVQRNGERFGV